MNTDTEFTERIQQGADGKYRWTYKLHMLKTSSIISEVFWALLITCLITWFIVFCLLLFSGEMSWEQFFASLGMIVLVLAILCVLCIPAYLIVAAMYGWYYIIRFTMDEDGITHEQLPRQMKKAQTLGCIVALVGLLAKRPTTAGSGLAALQPFHPREVGEGQAPAAPHTSERNPYPQHDIRLRRGLRLRL